MNEDEQWLAEVSSVEEEPREFNLKQDLKALWHWLWVNALTWIIFLLILGILLFLAAFFGSIEGYWGPGV